MAGGEASGSFFFFPISLFLKKCHIVTTAAPQWFSRDTPPSRPVTTSQQRHGLRCAESRHEHPPLLGCSTPTTAPPSCRCTLATTADPGTAGS